MSELTTIARPYAKAAFDFAIEQSAVEKWTEMLGFAAAVACLLYTSPSPRDA